MITNEASCISIYLLYERWNTIFFILIWYSSSLIARNPLTHGYSYSPTKSNAIINTSTTTIPNDMKTSRLDIPRNLLEQYSLDMSLHGRFGHNRCRQFHRRLFFNGRCSGSRCGCLFYYGWRFHQASRGSRRLFQFLLLS